MGLFKPTVRPDQPSSASEIDRLKAKASLPKSSGAGLLQAAGILSVVISALVAMTNPLGLLFAFGGAVSGGLIWSAGMVTQLMFDLRTLALRDADRRGSVSLEGAI